MENDRPWSRPSSTGIDRLAVAFLGCGVSQPTMTMIRLARDRIPNGSRHIVHRDRTRHWNDSITTKDVLRVHDDAWPRPVSIRARHGSKFGVLPPRVHANAQVGYPRDCPLRLVHSISMGARPVHRVNSPHVDPPWARCRHSNRIGRRDWLPVPLMSTNCTIVPPRHWAIDDSIPIEYRYEPSPSSCATMCDPLHALGPLRLARDVVPRT